MHQDPEIAPAQVSGRGLTSVHRGFYVLDWAELGSPFPETFGGRTKRPGNRLTGWTAKQLVPRHTFPALLDITVHYASICGGPLRAAQPAQPICSPKGQDVLTDHVRRCISAACSLFLFFFLLSAAPPAAAEAFPATGLAATDTDGDP